MQSEYIGRVRIAKGHISVDILLCHQSTIFEHIGLLPSVIDGEKVCGSCSLGMHVLRDD